MTPARVHPTAILEPGVVLGPGGALARMVGPYRWFLGGPLGSGKQWLSWIHMKDAVLGLLFALDSAALAGPFNLTAPVPVTMEHFARALGAALGRPAALHVPAFALKLAVGGMADALLTGQRAVPKKLADLGFRFAFSEVEGALADLVKST